MCACLNISFKAVGIILKPRLSDLFYILMETEDVWRCQHFFLTWKVCGMNLWR